jgi:peptidoglycan/LPS O-acetylase OafA/YrhL
MLIIVIILFLIAAALGLVILTAVLEERPRNKIILYLHGGIAGTAIILMLIDVLVFGGNPLLIISLVLFLLAAMGGLTLFTLDKHKKPIPKWLALGHPLVAFAGLIALVAYILP